MSEAHLVHQNVNVRFRAVIRFLNPLDVVGELRWSRVFLYYGISNVFHLASWNSKYWDQWFMYRDLGNFVAVERACPIYRCKIPLSFVWELPLLQLGTWALRTTVVIAFALAGWLFWRILKSTKILSPTVCSYATLFFVLLPINGARLGLSTARYSVVFVILLFGMFLLLQRNWYSSFTGLLLIAYSEFQPSNQVFALAIILPLMALDFSANGQIRRQTLGISAFLVILPLFHRWFLADLAVKLELAGPDDGYNTMLPIFVMRAVLVCGLLMTPLFLALLRHWFSENPWSELQLSLISVGLFLLALGTFPYMAVGHFANLTDWITMFLPDTSDWDSRHQINQGAGYCFILAGLIGKFKAKFQSSIVATLLIGCIIISSSTFANYYVDGLKQRDIVDALRSEAVGLNSVSVLVFYDEARDVNARGRNIRSYEWDALAEEALHRPVEIIEPSQLVGEAGCLGESVGRRITIRKVSGRLKTLIMRSQIVAISISDLVVCRD